MTEISSIFVHRPKSTHLYWHTKQNQQQIGEREVGQEEIGHGLHLSKVEHDIDDDGVACTGERGGGEVNARRLKQKG